jgi:hypothetical protein
MRCFWKSLCCCLWLLPLFAFGDIPHGIELRLQASEYFPGEIVELQAEMRQADFAEFQLHVPVHRQLHFVAHTREPVRYVEGEYVQRSVLLLQPMNAGEFDLRGMTASVQQGNGLTEVELPPVQFTVQSYGAFDDSKELAAWPKESVQASPASGFLRLFLLLPVVMLFVVWMLRGKFSAASAETNLAVATLDDLADAIERGESAVELIERLLARPDLSLSANLREALEASVYADRLDAPQVLQLIREEVGR